MTLLLRKSSAQARIEGWDPRNRSDDDYAVVEDTIVGRIYRELILGPSVLQRAQRVRKPINFDELADRMTEVFVRRPLER